MLLFLKVEAVGAKEGPALMAVKCDDGTNWLPLKSVSVGAGTNVALSAIESEEEKKKIRQSFRSSLIATVAYMQRRLPLSNPVIRDM